MAFVYGTAGVNARPNDRSRLGPEARVIHRPTPIRTLKPLIGTKWLHTSFRGSKQSTLFTPWTIDGISNHYTGIPGNFVWNSAAPTAYVSASMPLLMPGGTLFGSITVPDDVGLNCNYWPNEMYRQKEVDHVLGDEPDIWDRFERWRTIAFSHNITVLNKEYRGYRLFLKVFKRHDAVNTAPDALASVTPEVDIGGAATPGGGWLLYHSAGWMEVYIPPCARQAANGVKQDNLPSKTTIPLKGSVANLFPEFEMNGEGLEDSFATLATTVSPLRSVQANTETFAADKLWLAMYAAPDEPNSSGGLADWDGTLVFHWHMQWKVEFRRALVEGDM